ncbi:uberolysin/carnocyclin family circular bacteriocin [Paenibacillus thailandensis]|uniref:Uberolysin/carnocyclin family circular bacteriocin n=1 Tax=Paenibacillus thailandensis TaxID=393250 RepID=A0ABW5R117_9BACL
MEQLLMEIVAATGVSMNYAYYIIRLVMAGASVWTLVAAIFAGGGVLAVGALILRNYILKKLSADAAFKIIATY